MRKARPEYRIPAFYLINAVCHAAKTKLKDNKDHYANRFMEKGMPGFESLSACDEGEKKQIAKVLVFWVEEGIFPEVFARKVAKAVGIQLDLKDDGPSIQEQLEKRKAEEEAAEAAAAAAAANQPPPQLTDPRRAVDPRAQQQLLDVPPGIVQRGPPGWALPQGIMPVSMGPASTAPPGDMGRHDPRGGPSPPGAPPLQYGQPPPPHPAPAAPPLLSAPPQTSSGPDDQFYDDDDDDDEARREKQRKLMEAQAEQASRGGPGHYLPPPVMSQIQQQQQLLMQQQIEAARQNKLMQQQRIQPPPPGGDAGGMQGGFGQTRQHAMPSKDYVRSRKVGPGQKFEEVRIPNSSVGLIIGKQGSTIKNLQQQSGAFIQTQRDAECAPGSTDREVYLVGNDQQLAKAKQMIQEIVDNDPQVNGSAPPGGPFQQQQQRFAGVQAPETSQRGDPGNWNCPSCGNENWPKRTTCNRCQTPKPFDMVGSPPGPPPSQGGGWPPQQQQQQQHHHHHQQQQHQQLVEMPYVDGMPLRSLPDKPTAEPGADGGSAGGGANSPPAKRSKWS